jgi:hypothetical protein
VRYRYIRPSQTLLDPKNPRLPAGTSSDREAINRLLDDDAPALVRLARDIASRESANPATPPIVLQNGTKYLVLDGNRRFAALKLLKDPSLADTEEHQRAFKRAAGLGVAPETVYACIAADREEADFWIDRIHTGENGGAGTKPWNAEQKANFRKRAKKPIDSGTMRSMVIAHELEEAYSTDEELAALVRATRIAKITNIGRFFSGDVMQHMHLTIVVEEGSDLTSRRTLHAAHTTSQLRNFFLWAFKFIRENSVDAYKDAKIRKSLLDEKASPYIPRLADALDIPRRLVVDSLPNQSQQEESEAGDQKTDEGASQSSDGGETTKPEPENVDPSKNDSSKDGASGKKRPEAKAELFLLQGVKLPNHPDRVQRLLNECKLLNMETSPGVACILLRVLVELSVSSPDALALSGAQEHEHLDVKILKMLARLDPDLEKQRKRDGELAQAYFEAKGLGIQYLHAFVHNPLVHVDLHLARRFSSAFGPFLLRVDAALA